MAEGGCLCGRVRYAVADARLRSFCCHCRMCQRASGRPLMAVFFVPIAGLRLTKGQPRKYLSSETAYRHFCPDCGSPLFIERITRPDRLGVFAGSLDDPGEFRPDYHIWTSRQCPWLHLDTGDGVPRTLEGPPPA